MKIAYQNHEFEVAPAAQNIDVLLDVTDRTNGISGSKNLSNSITNYERLIISVWPQHNASSLAYSGYIMSNEVSVADVLADRTYVRPIYTIWDETEGNFLTMTFNSNTTVLLEMGPNSKLGRLKIEGVKRVEGIMPTVQDVTITKNSTYIGSVGAEGQVYGKVMTINFDFYTEAVVPSGESPVTPIFSWSTDYKARKACFGPIMALGSGLDTQPCFKIKAGESSVYVINAQLKANTWYKSSITIILQ